MEGVMADLEPHPACETETWYLVQSLFVECISDEQS